MVSAKEAPGGSQASAAANATLPGSGDWIALPPPAPISDGSGRASSASLDPLALTAEHPGRYDSSGRISGPRELGRGGLGKVTIAFDSHLGRQVAWKEMLPESAPSTWDSENLRDSPQVARFLREARITGQLEYPNIVPVYELGQRDDGRLYYTMKIVRGRTLREHLAACRTLADRLKLLPHYIDLCQAIAYAHSKGVIHRDIKPDNVMLGEFGETVVLDWGLAKARQQAEVAPERSVFMPEGDGFQTHDGDLIGTPAYVSPEQALGEVDKVDERSDVWSLGAVLYEILTGNPPFLGPNPGAIIARMLTKDLPDPRSIDSTIPAELSAICARALRKDPADRYPGARQLAEEIESFESGARVQAYVYSSWELFVRFASRHKLALSSALLVFSLVIVGSLVLLASYRREVQSNRVARYHMAQALQEKAARLIRDKEFGSAAVYAAAALIQDPAPPAGPQNDDGAGGSFSGNRDSMVRSVSLLYRARMWRGLTFKHRLAMANEPVQLSFSPDGTRLAVSDTHGEVSLFDTATAERRLKVKHHAQAIYAIAFSGDGRRVASGGYEGIRIWDTVTGVLTASLVGHSREVRAVLFLPDGRRVVSASDDGTVRLWEIESGRELRKLTEQAAGIMCLALSPDGNTLVWGSRDGSIRIGSTDEGKPQRILGGHGNVVSDLSFSPDGARFVSASWDQTVRTWDIGTGLQAGVLPTDTPFLSSVSFARDGHWLVTLGFERMSVWDAGSRDMIFSVPAFGNGTQNATAAPDGSMIALPVGIHAVEIWSAQPKQDLRFLGSHDNMVQQLLFSSDGKFLASASFDKTVKIWDATNARLLHTLRGHTDYAQSVAFSPDGASLASFGRDKTVRVWDLSTGAAGPVLRGLDLISRLAWSPDGNWIPARSSEGSLLLWSPSSGAIVRRPEVPLSALSCLAFVPSGLDLLISQPNLNSVRVVRVPDGPVRELSEIDASGGLSALHNQPAFVAVSSGGELGIWDLNSGERIRQLGAHGTTEGITLTMDDQFLVMANGQNGLRVLSLLSGQTELDFPRLYGTENAIVSPDGRELAMAFSAQIATIPLDFGLLDSMRASPARFLAEAQDAVGMQLDGFSLRPRTPRAGASLTPPR